MIIINVKNPDEHKVCEIDEEKKIIKLYRKPYETWIWYGGTRVKVEHKPRVKAS